MNRDAGYVGKPTSSLLKECFPVSSDWPCDNEEPMKGLFVTPSLAILAELTKGTVERGGENGF